MPHLFVDISSHGFGHLAQTAPILNALAERISGLRLSIRSGLPRERLASRLRPDFVHLPVASDFGYLMHDPLRVDLPATAARYRAAHADWPAAVGREAEVLTRLAPDFVFANASYLPLAGAAQAGIPAAACCSLNWGELFSHFYGAEPWARPIAAEILAAYASAPFLAIEPAMPMAALPNVLRLPPVATIVSSCRASIEERHPDLRGRGLGLAGFGGIPMAAAACELPAWAARGQALGQRIGWLVPEGWGRNDPDCVEQASLGESFSALLASCDAVITKPGYGTFVEAACAGTPVLWLRREDWPEQRCLIDWLEKNVAARELTAAELVSHSVAEALAKLWAMPRPARPEPAGAAAVADWLAGQLACQR